MYLERDAPSQTEENDDGITRLGDVDTSETQRLITGIRSLDAAFGGGFGLPSVVQFGGQPGIGKSTLLLACANVFYERTLYVTSEERIEQIADRAKRLRLHNIKKIRAIETLSPAYVKEMIIRSGADFVIIDSLQGLRADASDGGRRHTQLVVRDIALDLINFAQKKEEYETRDGHPVTFVMVCHVNKQGDLAGLKEIEHMVDVVAWFGGERSGKIRKVRLEKNRLGPTDKAAIFTMEEDGLHEKEEDEQPQPV